MGIIPMRDACIVYKWRHRVFGLANVQFYFPISCLHMSAKQPLRVPKDWGMKFHLKVQISVTGVGGGGGCEREPKWSKLFEITTLWCRKSWTNMIGNNLWDAGRKYGVKGHLWVSITVDVGSGGVIYPVQTGIIPISNAC